MEEIGGADDEGSGQVSDGAALAAVFFPLEGINDRGDDVDDFVGDGVVDIESAGEFGVLGVGCIGSYLHGEVLLEASFLVCGDVAKHGGVIEQPGNGIGDYVAFRTADQGVFEAEPDITGAEVPTGFIGGGLSLQFPEDSEWGRGVGELEDDPGFGIHAVAEPGVIPFGDEVDSGLGLQLPNHGFQWVIIRMKLNLFCQEQLVGFTAQLMAFGACVIV